MGKYFTEMYECGSIQVVSSSTEIMCNCSSIYFNAQTTSSPGYLNLQFVHIIPYIHCLFVCFFCFCFIRFIWWQCHHFVEPLVLCFSWLCPWVLKPGWMYLRSMSFGCNGSSESSGRAIHLATLAGYIHSLLHKYGKEYTVITEPFCAVTDTVITHVIPNLLCIKVSSSTLCFVVT